MDSRGQQWKETGGPALAEMLRCGNGGGRVAEVMRADLKCILKAEIKEHAHGYGY